MESDRDNIPGVEWVDKLPNYVNFYLQDGLEWYQVVQVVEQIRKTYLNNEIRLYADGSSWDFESQPYLSVKL